MDNLINQRYLESRTLKSRNFEQGNSRSDRSNHHTSSGSSSIWPRLPSTKNRTATFLELSSGWWTGNLCLFLSRNTTNVVSGTGTPLSSVGCWWICDPERVAQERIRKTSTQEMSPPIQKPPLGTPSLGRAAPKLASRMVPGSLEWWNLDQWRSNNVWTCYQESNYRQIYCPRYENF